MTKVEEVGQILPLSCGGGDNEDNLMSICKSCHSKIHARIGDRFNNKNER
ncbi:HNH endonuclease [Anaerococcus tetradius]|nr:HNH endonuclease [Anaerococcus tetradius]